MKINIVSFVGRSIAVLGLVLATSLGCAFAQGENGGGGRLEGTWDAVVTIRTCATGAKVTDFASIANFNRGGTFLGSTSGRPQASRTPEHGIWRHVSGNTYIFKFKSFDFDPVGIALGYGILTHTVELNESADTYTSTGSVDTFDMDGNFVRHGCSDAVGTRFEL